MKLTHPDAWHMYAGGTGAASDRHGYKAITTIGDYAIDPVSSRHNAERHIGYSVRFENVKGKLTGGLHQELNGGKLTTLPNARRACRTHCEEHGGALVPESLPH